MTDEDRSRADAAKRLKEKVRCYICDRLGHYARECRQRRNQTESYMAEVDAKIREDRAAQKSSNSKTERLRLDDSRRREQSSSESSSDDLALIDDVLTAEGTRNDRGETRTILDSGSTTHVVNNVNAFSFLEKLEVPRLVRVGKKGTVFKVEHKGEVPIDFFLPDGGVRKVVLCNCLFSPDSRLNIVSASRLCRAGCRVRITANTAEVLQENEDDLFICECCGEQCLHEQTNLIAIGYGDTGLYELDCEFPELRSDANARKVETHDYDLEVYPRAHDACGRAPMQTPCTADTDSVFTMAHQVRLHRLFAHSNRRAIARAVGASTGLRAVKRWRKSMPCAACELAATKRAPKGAVSCTPEPERMHCDTKKLKRSVRGFRYFTVMVHEGTKMIFVAKAKKKSQIRNEMKAIIKLH